MEQLKYDELLIMSSKGYSHIKDKTEASNQEEIMKDNPWFSIKL